MTDGQPSAAGGKKSAGSKSMQVLDTLRTVDDPAKDGNIVGLGYIKNLSIQEGSVRFDLILPEDTGLQDGDLDGKLEQAFGKLDWVTDVQFGVGHSTDQAAAAPAAASTPTPAPATPQQQGIGH